MIADSAITGGTLTLREREYGVKVDAAGSHEIIGYAGDVSMGSAGIESASKETIGRNTIQHLAELTKSSPSAEFAYGYCEKGELHLLKISDGRWQDRTAFTSQSKRRIGTITSRSLLQAGAAASSPTA